MLPLVQYIDLYLCNIVLDVRPVKLTNSYCRYERCRLLSKSIKAFANLRQIAKVTVRRFLGQHVDEHLFYVIAVLSCARMA